MNKILFLSFVLLSLVACNDAKVNSNSSKSSNITENTYENGKGKSPLII